MRWLNPRADVLCPARSLVRNALTLRGFSVLPRDGSTRRTSDPEQQAEDISPGTCDAALLLLSDTVLDNGRCIEELQAAVAAQVRLWPSSCCQLPLATILHLQVYITRGT